MDAVFRTTRLAFFVHLPARGRKVAGGGAQRGRACGSKCVRTRGEADLFIRLAPEFDGRLQVIENGVDTAYFAPSDDRSSPYAANEAPIVFTGAMDYWPNIDAVSWFVREFCRGWRSNGATPASISWV